MSLIQELDTRLVQATQDRNEDTVDCLETIKTRISVLQASRGLSGELTDDVVQKLIASYVKKMQKSLNDIERCGGRDSDVANKYRFEIDYLAEFLPKLMDMEQTRRLVTGLIAETGASAKKDKGKVMSVLMKKYRGRVDPKLASQVCDQLLS